MKLTPEKMRVVTQRCRRRLRHQAVSLSRIRAGRGRRRAPAQAGEMGGRAQRAFPRRHARAATISRPRGWRSTTRASFLALDIDIVADMGAYLSCLRALHPLARRRHGDRRLRHPDRLCAAARRLHQHRAGRRLSRRRAAGGVLPDRAAGRRRRARARRRARRAAQAAISSSRRRCPTRRRPARSTTPATSPASWRARRSSPTGTASTSAPPHSKRAGKLRGIGLATYIEACGNNGPETATLTLERDGGVTVLIGSQSTGQGHATAYAQLVAEHLDLPPEQGRAWCRATPTASRPAPAPAARRSIPIGGVSVDRAGKKLAEQIKEIAADALEASAGDLEIADGAVRIAGTDRAMSFAEIAAHPRATPEQAHRGQRIRATSRRPSRTAPMSPRSRSIPATGEVAILNYVVVDDFGATLNPLLLAGQVHGGSVQGIGQALMEDTVYDAASGQLLSASLMDYALPRAADAPAFHLRDAQRAVQDQPARRQGRGRGRRHRLLPGGDQRGRRRALARPRHRAISTCRRRRRASGRRCRRPRRARAR